MATDYREYIIRRPLLGLYADTEPTEVPVSARLGHCGWHIQDHFRIINERLVKCLGWEPWCPSKYYQECLHIIPYGGTDEAVGIGEELI